MRSFIRPLFFLLSSFLAAASVVAAPVWSGANGYEFVNQKTQVALTVDAITNDSPADATGTLEVQLWACPVPYESGKIQGVLVGSAKLQALAPGQAYKALRRVVPYTCPPQTGTYYMVMLLLENRGSTYVIAQHSTLKSTAALGPVPLFALEAPWNCQVSMEAGTVEISVAKISYRGPVDTGTLKLEVWATAAPYRGGPLRGFEIGEVLKEPLKPNFNYTNILTSARYMKPPPGNYYLGLVLLESINGTYNVVAYIEPTTTTHF